MPDVPDFIRERMDARLEYGTEEFVARRVLRGAGIVGKGPTSELRKNFAAKDVTLFDMAKFLILARLDHLEPLVLADSAKSLKEARAQAASHPKRDKFLILLMRVKEKATVMMSVDKQWLLTLFEPPYTVPSTGRDGEVMFEQDAETFARTIGVDSAAKDILHGRLRT